MDKKSWITFAAIALFVVLLSAIIYEMASRNVSMQGKCAETELYVIGDKGHMNRVYDCSGIDMDYL